MSKGADTCPTMSKEAGRLLWRLVTYKLELDSIHDQIGYCRAAKPVLEIKLDFHAKLRASSLHV